MEIAKERVHTLSAFCKYWYSALNMNQYSVLLCRQTLNAIYFFNSFNFDLLCCHEMKPLNS